jgi:RHS repeat-associated protein
MVMQEETIPSGQVWKTYYYTGSQRVAMRVNDGETDDVYYLFSDHLGSTSITTDSEGDLYGEMRYTAWGEVRYTSGQIPTDYTYTGQRSEVSSFGLMYYNARWYDSALGRFAEGDSIVPWVGNVLAWDRYSYVYNNPLNIIDPSGFDPIYIEGWDDDYLQQQEGNTCAVVSVAVSLSILYGHKITQQDVQPAFFWTYRIEERHSMEWDDGLSTYTINSTIYPGLGVIPQIQAYAVDKFDPGLEAAYTRGTRADLLENLNNGIPAIVSIALPAWDIGHALVVIGYDPETEELQFFDPVRGVIGPESEILERWNKNRGFASFEELWASSNIFIPANSMVTIYRVDVKLPNNGIYTAGGGQIPGFHMFR